VFGQSPAADRFGSEWIAIDGNINLTAKDIEAADMVAMFMSKEDPIELARGNTTFC
jgi:hypothetical protein